MRRRASAFVGDPVRWRQIEAVAAQLGRDGELDGDQVGRIMEGVADADAGGDRRAPPTDEPGG
jgi:hypothetical protein